MITLIHGSESYLVDRAARDLLQPLRAGLTLEFNDEEIQVHLLKPTDAITLNATDIEFNSAAVQSSAITGAVEKLTAASSGLEVNFVPDHRVLDGRFANNVWLQELPDPVTKLTWDNALLLSPATARKLGLKTHDRATVKTRGGSLWLFPSVIRIINNPVLAGFTTFDEEAYKERLPSHQPRHRQARFKAEHDTQPAEPVAPAAPVEPVTPPSEPPTPPADTPAP